MATGILFCSVFGLVLGVIFESSTLIAITLFSVQVGVVLGLAIGAVVESKYKKAGMIRPLNEKEKRMKRIGIWIGLIILILGLAAFFGLGLGD